MVSNNDAGDPAAPHARRAESVIRSLDSRRLAETLGADPLEQSHQLPFSRT